MLADLCRPTYKPNVVGQKWSVKMGHRPRKHQPKHTSPKILPFGYILLEHFYRNEPFKPWFVVLILTISSSWLECLNCQCHFLEFGLKFWPHFQILGYFLFNLLVTLSVSARMPEMAAYLWHNYLTKALIIKHAGYALASLCILSLAPWE
jgi:hypothetical protein